MTTTLEATKNSSQPNENIQLSDDERQFIQKANNAGLAVSFTPQGADKPVTFLPSENQQQNAEKTRDLNKSTEQGLPYISLLEEKKAGSGVAVISAEEGAQIPYMPALRQSFFETLDPKVQAFVLKANLSGLDVTARGKNGKSFLYLAPQNDAARETMRNALTSLQQNKNNLLAGNQRTVTENSTAMPLAQQHQHQ